MRVTTNAAPSPRERLLTWVREQAAEDARRYAGNSNVWVRPGVLITLRAFEPGTQLMVCASARYRDTRHFDRPQPGLIDPDQVP